MRIAIQNIIGLLFVASFASSLLTGCSVIGSATETLFGFGSSNETSGSGSDTLIADTTSRQELTGTLLDVSGEPVPRAHLEIYRQETTLSKIQAIPDPVSLPVTNQNGRFRTSLSPGIYNILGFYGHSIAFIDSIVIEEDPVEISGVVKEPGSLHVSLMESSSTLEKRFAVHLLGTPYFKVVSNGGYGTFAKVPAGNHTLVVFEFLEDGESGSSTLDPLYRTITIESGIQTKLDSLSLGK